MAHSYHSLKSIFHQTSHGQSSVDEAHALRLQSPSTICWDYQVRGKDLFVVVTTRLHSLCERYGAEKLLFPGYGPCYLKLRRATTFFNS